MSQTNSGTDLVDVLTAVTGSPESFELNVVRPDIDLRVNFGNFRQGFDQSK